MTEKEIMMVAMNKFIFYSFNYPDYEEMIHYITRGSEVMFNHLKEKWLGLYESVGANAVMPMFYCELVTEYRRLMLEYIVEYYDDEQRI